MDMWKKDNETTYKGRNTKDSKEKAEQFSAVYLHILCIIEL